MKKKKHKQKQKQKKQKQKQKKQKQKKQKKQKQKKRKQKKELVDNDFGIDCSESLVYCSSSTHHLNLRLLPLHFNS